MLDQIAEAHGDIVEQAERLLQNVGVPAQPQAVADVSFELAMPDADFDQIAEIIATDPSLAARTLKLVNSPLIGLPKKVFNIKQAISMLGIERINNMLITTAFQEAVAGSHDTLNEQFWSHSLMVARTAELIARQTLMMPEFATPAYLAGLFHDSAAPLFRKKYGDYDDLLVAALGQAGEPVAEEERRYATNHCVVGYLVAKNWRLPEAVAEAIWFHHEPGLDMHSDPICRLIKAVLLLAEHIALSDGTLQCETHDTPRWIEAHPQVLSELKLTPDDIDDLKEDALIAFGEVG